MHSLADSPSAPTPAAPSASDFARLPGLFRRWELEQVVEPGREFRIEPAGETSDRTALFAIYTRHSARDLAG